MDEDLDLSKNIEIQDALKEFEEKSKAEPVQNIQQIHKSIETPKIVQLVIKYSGGAIKDEKQADYVILTFSIIIFSISMYLFFGNRLRTPLLKSTLPLPPSLSIPLP